MKMRCYQGYFHASAYKKSGSRKVAEAREPLHPAAHPRLIGQVLLSEGAFQVTLLPLDHLPLNHVPHQRQQDDGPKRAPENGYPSVDHRQSEVAWVAAVAERPILDDSGYGLVDVHRSVSAAHRPSEPSDVAFLTPSYSNYV